MSVVAERALAPEAISVDGFCARMFYLITFFDRDPQRPPFEGVSITTTHPLTDGNDTVKVKDRRTFTIGLEIHPKNNAGRNDIAPELPPWLVAINQLRTPESEVITPEQLYWSVQIARKGRSVGDYYLNFDNNFGLALPSGLSPEAQQDLITELYGMFSNSAVITLEAAKKKEQGARAEQQSRAGHMLSRIFRTSGKVLRGAEKIISSR